MLYPPAYHILYQIFARPRLPRGHADPQMILLISGKQNEARCESIHETAHRRQGHGQQLLTRKAPGSPHLRKRLVEGAPGKFEALR